MARAQAELRFGFVMPTAVSMVAPAPAPCPLSAKPHLGGRTEKISSLTLQIAGLIFFPFFSWLMLTTHSAVSAGLGRGLHQPPQVLHDRCQVQALLGDVG